MLIWERVNNNWFGLCRDSPRKLLGWKEATWHLASFHRGISTSVQGPYLFSQSRRRTLSTWVCPLSAKCLSWMKTSVRNPQICGSFHYLPAEYSWFHSIVNISGSYWPILMKFSQDILDIMLGRPGCSWCIQDKSTRLTLAPDSQESHKLKVRGPYRCLWRKSLVPLRSRNASFATLKRCILLLRSRSGFSP